MTNQDLAQETLQQWPEQDWCEATIAVGDTTVGCFFPERRGLHAAHRGAADHLVVEWDDQAPGAA